MANPMSSECNPTSDLSDQYFYCPGYHGIKASQIIPHQVPAIGKTDRPTPVLVDYTVGRTGERDRHRCRGKGLVSEDTRHPGVRRESERKMTARTA